MKFITFVFLSLLFGANIFAQANMDTDAQRNVAETKDVAARALANFQKTGRENFKPMGFESGDELAGATLAEPLSVFMVELESLRGYQTGSDPNKLLKPIDKVVYPLAAKEQVRSSVIVQKGKEGWEATSIGGGNFARRASTAREELAKSTSLASNAFFVVQVPSLNAYFVGYRQDGKLMLASLANDLAMNLRAGAPLPAEQVFAQLAPVAQKYNGLPM